MSDSRTFKQFVAEGIHKHSKVIDIDKAYVMAEELWYDATVKKDKRAQRNIGLFARKYREG